METRPNSIRAKDFDYKAEIEKSAMKVIVKILCGNSAIVFDQGILLTVAEWKQSEDENTYNGKGE
jgi:hypothetical protein